MWITCVKFPENMASIPNKFKNYMIMITDQNSRQDKQTNSWSLNVYSSQFLYIPSLYPLTLGNTLGKFPSKLELPSVNKYFITLSSHGHTQLKSVRSLSKRA